MDSFLDELDCGIVRKKDNKIVYTNKYLQGCNLENATFVESTVHPDVFFVTMINVPTSDILDNIQIGVYKSVDSVVVYINKFLLDLLNTDTLVHPLPLNESGYSRLDTRTKSYIMEQTFVNDFYVLTDKTELLELKHSLENTSKLLDIHQSEKQVFVSNITHNIKAPLSSIINLLSLIKTNITLSQQQSYISMMQESSYELLEIINDILDYTKLEIGNISLVNETANITDLIEHVISIAKEMSKTKKIRFNTFISIDIPETFDIDTKRLTQIILNLVSYSLQQSSSIGSIEISVHALTQDEYNNITKDIKICDSCGNFSCNLCQHDLSCNCKVTKCICCKKIPNPSESFYIRFDITDTNEPLESSKKRELFTNSFTEDHPGLLGLYIAHRLVYLMDGVVFIDHTRIHGNRFTFVVKVYKERKLVLNNTLLFLKDPNVRMDMLNLVSRYSTCIALASSVKEAEFYTSKQNIDCIISDDTLFLERQETTTKVSYKTPSSSVDIKVLNEITDVDFSRLFEN